VHELTHVYQYERTGGFYLMEALHAQITRGGSAYDYGGPSGLVEAHKNGKPLRAFNREEQAQIAMHYYEYVLQSQLPLTPEQQQAYEFYIHELRAGNL
jgi:hypothetical protein